MSDSMIEQLWYTWSDVGIDRIRSGFRIRAASSGLSSINSDDVENLLPYLYYYPPAGIAASTLTDERAPISFALIQSGQTRFLVYKQFVRKPARGPSSIFFIHLLDKVPQEFSVRDALLLWHSSFWQASDRDLKDYYETTLEQVSLRELQAEVHKQEEEAPPPRFELVEELLPFVLQAYLTKKGGSKQPLYIAASDDDVIRLLRGLTACLPAGLTNTLTFSTYEKDVLASPTEIVGTCVIQQAKQENLPSVFSERNRLAINGYSKEVPACLENPRLVEVNPLATRFAHDATAYLVSGTYADRFQLLLVLAECFQIKAVAKYLDLYSTVVDGKPKPEKVCDAVQDAYGKLQEQYRKSAEKQNIQQELIEKRDDLTIAFSIHTISEKNIDTVTIYTKEVPVFLTNLRNTAFVEDKPLVTKFVQDTTVYLVNGTYACHFHLLLAIAECLQIKRITKYLELYFTVVYGGLDEFCSTVQNAYDHLKAQNGKKENIRQKYFNKRDKIIIAFIMHIIYETTPLQAELSNEVRLPPVFSERNGLPINEYPKNASALLTNIMLIEGNPLATRFAQAGMTYLEDEKNVYRFHLLLAIAECLQIKDLAKYLDLYSTIVDGTPETICETVQTAYGKLQEQYRKSAEKQKTHQPSIIKCTNLTIAFIMHIIYETTPLQSEPGNEVQLPPLLSEQNRLAMNGYRKNAPALLTNIPFIENNSPVTKFAQDVIAYLDHEENVYRFHLLLAIAECLQIKDYLDLYSTVIYGKPDNVCDAAQNAYAQLQMQYRQKTENKRIQYHCIIKRTNLTVAFVTHVISEAALARYSNYTQQRDRWDQKVQAFSKRQKIANPLTPVNADSKHLPGKTDRDEYRRPINELVLRMAEDHEQWPALTELFQSLVTNDYIEGDQKLYLLE